MLDAAVKIVKSTRFDDVDHDLGYEYRGHNYAVQNDGKMFLFRTYDDEPVCAKVVSPTTAHANGSLRQLVAFLQAEFGVSRICLYKADLGITLRSTLKRWHSFPFEFGGDSAVGVFTHSGPEAASRCLALMVPIPVGYVFSYK